MIIHFIMNVFYLGSRNTIRVLNVDLSFQLTIKIMNRQKTKGIIMEILVDKVGQSVVIQPIRGPKEV